MSLGLLAVLTVILPETSSGLPAPPAGRHWQLVFDDEFDGSRLNADRWVTCYDWYDAAHDGCTNNGNFEQEWYRASQVSVSNGHATLTAQPRPTLGWSGSYEQTYPYISGLISTGRPSYDAAPKWSTSYGYMEARLKTDGGQGLWPAFWLLPTDHSWPPEIDAMELVGSAPHQLLATYHWPDAAGHPQKDATTYSAGDFTAGWHTYAVNWQPGRIDWYADGRHLKTLTGSNVTNKPMELIINLAVGGTLPGNANAKTHFPARLQIDYVRVYQLTH